MITVIEIVAACLKGVFLSYLSLLNSKLMSKNDFYRFAIKIETEIPLFVAPVGTQTAAQPPFLIGGERLDLLEKIRNMYDCIGLGPIQALIHRNPGAIRQNTCGLWSVL